MLTRRRRLAAGPVALLLLAACNDDGGSGGSEGADRLADRVVGVLEAQGDAVDGDLEGADVSCPTVRDPEPGDRATCVIRFDDGRRVEVDVEFDADGSIAVVAVVPG